MLTVREVGREDRATATVVGENYQHASKELRWGKNSLQVGQIKITDM